jgi:hypothetical protein
MFQRGEPPYVNEEINMHTHWLTIIGLIMIFFGTLFTFLGQQAISDRSTKKIEKLSEENKSLINEVSKLNKKISADLTGGDGYCYFHQSRPGPNSNIVDLMLMNDGDYPLYDISVKIDDVEKMIEILHEEQEAGKLPYDSMTLSNAIFAKASTVIQIGNIGPHQVMQLNGIQIPPDIEVKSYNIYITARNGSLMQILRYRRIENKWKMAGKILRGGETIQEYVDADFPRNEKGEVVW